MPWRNDLGVRSYFRHLKTWCCTLRCVKIAQIFKIFQRDPMFEDRIKVAVRLDLRFQQRPSDVGWSSFDGMQCSMRDMTH